MTYIVWTNKGISFIWQMTIKCFFSTSHLRYIGNCCFFNKILILFILKSFYLFIFSFLLLFYIFSFFLKKYELMHWKFLMICCRSWKAVIIPMICSQLLGIIISESVFLFHNYQKFNRNFDEYNSKVITYQKSHFHFKLVNWNTNILIIHRLKFWWFSF